MFLLSSKYRVNMWFLCHAVMAHAFNPGEAKAGGSLIIRPA